MSKNKEIAGLLFELADLLEIKGIEWKPNAYRKAAQTIESLGRPVEDVYSKGGISALKKLAGIGEGIAKKIEEFLKTGKIKELSKLLKKFPKGLEKMMDIEGVGPRTALELFERLKVKSLSDLEKAAKTGKIRKLKGFGEKSEREIIEGIKLLKKGKNRKLLSLALMTGREICEDLSKVSAVKKVVIAGSTRRMKETVHDLDILVLSSKPEQVMSAVVNLPEVDKVIARGKTKTSVRLKEGLQVDVRVLAEKSFGAGLQYFTGNKAHNVKLRQIAIKKGYKLSEYGLFKKDKFICGRTEDVVYKKLGLKTPPPEIRQNKGEIEAAREGKLPELISYNSLKGDLHMHTKWSDGSDSIADMAAAAEKIKYKYIALTDHSKSQHIAHGLEVKRLLKYLKEVEKINKSSKVHIFKGAEVDILSDGSLDYENKYLKKLDVVVASVHSGFRSSRDEMTKRLLKALDNPHVNILAHPTGRLINQRRPYEFDFKKVFEQAKESNVALEISSSPLRLDLNSDLIRIAKDIGCKFSIDTDSHSQEHLRFSEFGIGQARRAWLSEKDVINTWSLKKLQKFLKK